MRIRSKLTVVPSLALACLVFVETPLASEVPSPGQAGLVDFRMAPLEQVKKINVQVQSRDAAGETRTIMTWSGVGDARHMIVDQDAVTPELLRADLEGGTIDSVSWSHAPATPMGTCDSTQECQDQTDEMCRDAGHGGVDESTVIITMHADGSKTCSGDCESHGAVAFVTCNPHRS